MIVMIIDRTESVRRVNIRLNTVKCLDSTFRWKLGVNPSWKTKIGFWSCVAVPGQGNCGGHLAVQMGIYLCSETLMKTHAEIKKNISAEIKDNYFA